jgi:septal ring-binding cell division protein DamX
MSIFMFTMFTRKIPLFVSLILVSATAASISAAPFWEKKKDVDSREQHSDNGNRSDVPTTYLDSLNRGKEVRLEPKDFSSSAPVSHDTVPVVQTDKPDQFTGYRVQCVASSQIETIRAEKKNLEAKVTNTVSIVYTAPYYKLMIGDFSRRVDADSAVSKLKALGYADAWVVTGKGAGPKP